MLTIHPIIDRNKNMKSFVREAADRWTEQTQFYIIFTLSQRNVRHRHCHHWWGFSILLVLPFLFSCFVPKDFSKNICGHSGSLAEMMATRLSSSLRLWHSLHLTHSPTRLILYRSFIFFIPEPIWIYHVFGVEVPDRWYLTVYIILECRDIGSSTLQCTLQWNGWQS